MGWDYRRKERGITMSKTQSFLEGLNSIPKRLTGGDVVTLPASDDVFNFLGLLVGVIILLGIASWIVIKVIDRFDSFFNRKF